MLAPAGLAFGPYLLDSRARSLTRGGERVGLSPYEYEVLHLLAHRANVTLSKGVLISAGRKGRIVGDNSLEKLVGNLRRRMDAGDPDRYIKTVPRKGCQFVAAVTPVPDPDGESDLELPLAPDPPFTEGRAAGLKVAAVESHDPSRSREYVATPVIAARDRSTAAPG